MRTGFFRQKFACGAAAIAIALTAAAPCAAQAADISRIEYLGGADGMVAPDTDLFESFGAMMPGDRASGIVDVRNSGTARAALWFWADGAETKRGAEELLDEVQVEIVSLATDETVYAGPLRADGMGDPISLGEYAPGESAELAYSIYVPEYLGNAFMEAESGVTWTFAAEELAGESDDKGKSEGGGGKTDLPDTSGAPGNSSGFFDKTGVDTSLLLNCGAVLVAVGAGAAAVGRRGRREGNRN